MAQFSRAMYPVMRRARDLHSNEHLLAGFLHVKNPLQKGLLLHGILTRRLLGQEYLEMSATVSAAIDRHGSVMMINHKEARQQVEAVFFGITTPHKEWIEDAV